MNAIKVNTLSLLIIALTAGGCAQLIGLEKPDGDEADAGNSGTPADAADPQGPDSGALPPDSERRVFVTSDSYDGALGGLAGADQICQTEATNAALDGQWIAWLADDVESPATRFVRGTNNYRLLDTTIIANDWDDLVDGNLDAPLNYSTAGPVTGSDKETWTNVTSLGGIRSGMPDAHCARWTDNGDVLTGVTGENNQADSRWTLIDDFSFFCFSSLRLYCFER